MAKIYLSPSIQQSNRFCVGGITEAQNSNAVTDILEKALKEKYGFEVCRNNVNMSLSQVIADSNSKGVDIHVSIHSNAGGGRGCEVYTGWTSNSKRLSQCLYDEMASVTPSSDRGIKDGRKLAEINNTKAYASLVEMAFHDNVEDAEWLISHRVECARALEKGICKYFNVAYIPDKVEPPKEEEGYLYRVQVGAFSTRERADKYLATLKSAGFDGFVVKVKK